MAVSNQQTHSLISHFLTQYQQKHNGPPRDFNRHRDKWGFQSMIEDLGMARAREIVTYYFSLPNNSHTVNGLLFNYDKLNTDMMEREEDEIERRRIRAETKQRVEEWRKRIERK
jgi:hypothetical protein